MEFYIFLKIVNVLSILLSSALCSENLARNKPTKQSSPLNNETTSDKAVDGFYDLDLSKTSCAAAVSNSGPIYWQVDIGTAVTITHIRLVYEVMSDDSTYLRNHEVFVSSETTAGGKRCYKENRLTTQIDPVKNEVICFAHGRYITYYTDFVSNGNRAFHLCEVEVFGCPSGYYGSTCADKCSPNCATQPCEPDFGRCINGCQSGYTGESCTEVCPTGFYGPGCGLACRSTCLECNNVNGTCRQCVDGYTGVMCEIHINGTTESVVGDGALQANDNPTTPFIIVIVVLATILLFLVVVIAYNLSVLRKSHPKKSTKPQNSVSQLNQGGTFNTDYDYASPMPPVDLQTQKQVFEYEIPVTSNKKHQTNNKQKYVPDAYCNSEELLHNQSQQKPKGDKGNQVINAVKKIEELDTVKKIKKIQNVQMDKDSKMYESLDKGRMDRPNVYDDLRSKPR